jgi:hypothetical protein
VDVGGGGGMRSEGCGWVGGGGGGGSSRLDCRAGVSRPEGAFVGAGRVVQRVVARFVRLDADGAASAVGEKDLVREVTSTSPLIVLILDGISSFSQAEVMLSAAPLVALCAWAPPPPPSRSHVFFCVCVLPAPPAPLPAVVCGAPPVGVPSACGPHSVHQRRRAQRGASGVPGPGPGPAAWPAMSESLSVQVDSLQSLPH